MEEDEEKSYDFADYYRSIRGMQMNENDVFRLSEELNRALLESEEYKKYVSAGQAVKAEPELYRAMNDYRRRNRQIQMYASDEAIFDETNRVLYEFEGVLKNELVAEFLAAEQKLVRMLQQVYANLGSNLEFDDSFIEG